MQSQLSSAQLSYSSAAQRRAVPCGTVPYPAVQCCAVLCRAELCCAVLSFVHTLLRIMRSTSQGPDAGMYACTRLCAFFIDCLLGPLHLFYFSRKVHPHCRSQRDIASKHTSQHRAITFAQVALGIIKSLVAPNHGPLMSAPFTHY